MVSGQSGERGLKHPAVPPAASAQVLKRDYGPAPTPNQAEEAACAPVTNGNLIMSPAKTLKTVVSRST